MAKSPSQQMAKARQSLTESFVGLTEEITYMGITGRGDTEKTVLVADRPGYIYVRVPRQVVTGALEEFSEVQAFSPDETRHNVMVFVTQSSDNPSRYDVSDIAPTTVGNNAVETAIGSVAYHRASHELYSGVGGHDVPMLDTAQLRNLQVTPTSPPSSRVVVGSGWYIWKDRAVHFYDGTEVDLAVSVPTGTISVTYISLWLEPNTGSIIQNPVMALDTPSRLPDIEDLLIWPEEDHIPLAGVRLTDVNYSITWSSDGIANIIDMRPHQALMPGDMLPAGHPLSPGGGYHSGTLEAVHVSFSDPSGVFDGDNVQDILEDELGPERTMVRVSVDDTTPGFLEDKTAAGAHITFNTLDPAGNEQLEISSVGGGGSSGTLELQEDDVLVMGADTLNFEGDGAFVDFDVIDEGSGKGTISGTFDESHLDSRYFRKDEFIDSSAGAGDAFKPVVLDANGEIDSSMIADDYVLTTGDIMTGTLQINVATEFNEALILKTTDNDSTKNLFETQNSGGTVLTAIQSDGAAIFQVFDSGTTNSISPARFVHRTSGTPSTTFGTNFILAADDDGAEDQALSVLQSIWTNATHASRKARLSLLVFDTAQRSAIIMDADGAQSRTSIGGLPPLADVSLAIRSPAPTYKPLVLRGAAAQSTALIQLQESDGSVMLDSGDGLGGSVFSGNQQLEDIDFVWAGDNEANLFRVDADVDAVGVGIAAPLARLHVDQSSTSGAKPVITLDQADVDEDFFKFIGTSDTNVDRALVDAADFTTPGSIVGWLKINIQDDQGTNPIADGDYYISFSSAPAA